MSGLDQSLVIAQSGYHVGHERSWRAAEEQGYVKEEGLENYVYEPGGLIPARFEADALGLQMWERGVDVATAVNVWSAIKQRARGEDVYIVGGWRIMLGPKLIGAKGITRPEQLKGAKSMARETAGMGHLGIVTALRTFGVQPQDIEWIKNPLAGYGSDPTMVDSLRSGEIQFLSLGGDEASQLVSEGHPVVLDLEEFYRQRGAWPPGRVIVANRQTIEQRGEKLRAFLRASLRGFWFVEDPRNYRYMYDLETRLREKTFNEDERRLRMLKSETPPASRQERRDTGPMAMDGLVSRPGLGGVIDSMVQFGELDRAIDVDDVLKDATSIDSLQQVLDRGLIDRRELEEWRRAKGYAAAG
jgi:ABC-type nitrate/sulfonate/bicarbonate transport system substrate-binding protein